MKQGNSDYILNVTILSYDQPWVGLDFDIKKKTKWELTDARKLTPVWSDTFETTNRAKVSNALIAAERAVCNKKMGSNEKFLTHIWCDDKR